MTEDEIKIQAYNEAVEVVEILKYKFISKNK